MSAPRPELLCILAGVFAICVVLYRNMGRRKVALNLSLRVDYLGNALVIMPLDRWSTITKKGLSLAVQLKGQIRVVHVAADESKEEFVSLWSRNVVAPLEDADRAVPELVFLESPKGRVIRPMAEYILDTERDEPDRQIIVVVPQLGVRHWWQRPLHNHRSWMLKLMLSALGSRRLMVIDVPWYL
jgi:hypothetical protein